MTNRTASPASTTARPKPARRGGPSGRQTVGDYVGQPAIDAAQAVRRAGFRPGLDRSFGCAEELFGLVVAQEPAAGSSLARNEMVTLYVAAPGSEETGDATDSGGVEAAQTAASPSSGQAAPRHGEAPGLPSRVRRRKRGRAQRVAPEFGVPPAPVPVPRAPQPRTLVLVQPAIGRSAEQSREPEGPAEERRTEETPASQGDVSDEEFVVHVEDVLSGRSGPPAWRRAYPRDRTSRTRAGRRAMRAWVAGHRLASAAVGAAILLWVIVGGASALDGQRSHPERGSATRSSESSPAERRARSAKALPVQGARRRRPAPRPAARPGRPRPAADTRKRHGPRAPVVEAALPAAEVAQTPPPTVPVPAAPRAAEPAATARDQVGGGLFSP
jgi:hypothetical protein